MTICNKCGKDFTPQTGICGLCSGIELSLETQIQSLVVALNKICDLTNLGRGDDVVANLACNAIRGYDEPALIDESE